MTPVVVSGIRDSAKSILHDDKAHQDWLIEATERFIAGKKPPRLPRIRSWSGMRHRAHARSATSGGRRSATGSRGSPHSTYDRQKIPGAAVTRAIAAARKRTSRPSAYGQIGH